MFSLNQIAKRTATVNRSVPVIKRLFASLEEPLSQVSQASTKPVASKKYTHNPQTPQNATAPSQKRIFANKKKGPKKNKGSNKISLPRHNWIKLSDVPPLATLDDIIDSVNRVLNVESAIGIIDLDASKENEDASFPRLKLDPSERWVKNAQVILSTHARPTSWGIELGNRSIVNAFLQHTRENGFYCAWKKSVATEWEKKSERKYCNPSFDIDECVVRVENCNEQVSPTLLRTIFRHYDLSKVTPNIYSWENEHMKKHNKIFLLRFDNPSWARAAIRDLQGATAYEVKLRLAQYPKQSLE